MSERFDSLSRAMATSHSRRGVLKMFGMAAGGAAVATVLKPFRGSASVTCSGPTNLGPSPCAAGQTPCGPCCCERGIACLDAGRGVCGCPVRTTPCGSACCKTGTACADLSSSRCATAAVACTQGQVACGTMCCPTGTACVNGVCGCATGTTDCGGRCVDLQTDSFNCGGCGIRCSSGQTCCSGHCVDTQIDSTNCGSCGQVCSTPSGGAATCVGGICGSTCPDGTIKCPGVCAPPAFPVCCGDNSCSSDAVCCSGVLDEVQYSAPFCALPGGQCCGAIVCAPGTRCEAGVGATCCLPESAPAGSSCCGNLPNGCPPGTTCVESPPGTFSCT